MNEEISFKLNNIPMKICLFLCTGNYYRSRLAEEMFNFLAEKLDSTWRAESRGLRLYPSAVNNNKGSLSPHVIEELSKRNIPITQINRDPIQVSSEELFNSHYIVAMKKSEHKPLLAKQFPDFPIQVECWNIDDANTLHPSKATDLIWDNVRKLILRLDTSQTKVNRTIPKEISMYF